jgi:uncharacterized SAM-dependent methyltransferase
MTEEKEIPQINDLIFKELIKRGYSLEGNTRIWNIADSKLWYLTPDQAQAYLDLENSEEYNEAMINREIRLLEKQMPEIKEHLPDEDKIIIMDIGCGDGKKAIVPIEFLKKEGKKIVYCPIDISGHMVEKAKQNISKLDIDELVEFKWNISDFENLENVIPLLRRNKDGILMLFLGSTIGNFEIHEVLYGIRESMGPKDRLLIGVELDPSGEKKNAEVDYSEVYKTGHVDNFLGKVLEQLGFKRDEIKFGSRYKNHRVECFYTIGKNKEIKFQDKKIEFHKGDQIIVSVSYKYDEVQFEEALNLYFDDCDMHLNEDKSWALALCKK